MSAIISLYNSSSSKRCINCLITSLALGAKIIMKQIQKLPLLRGWVLLAPISRQGRRVGGEKTWETRCAVNGIWNSAYGI